MKLFILLLLVMFTISIAYAEPLIGGQRDAHGCLIPAGYSWCESLQKCIRPWETPCPKNIDNGRIIGGDKDEHGCLIAAGYSWCESLHRCIRPWETSCPNRIDHNDSSDKFDRWSPVIPNDFDIHKYMPKKPYIIDPNVIPSNKWPIPDIFNPGCNPQPVPNHEVNFCTKSERDSEICTMLYAPVCGWTDGGPKTYGNKCVACSSKQVDYWVDGQC